MSTLIIIDDGGISPVGFLDDPALGVLPTACFSLRRLISSAGAAIKVRRSSDNAEMDVGFVATTVGSALDSTAMLAWSGSDSVYVVTFYDQTGAGFNATQATAANQPRIVNAGVYDGKLVFDASNDSLKISALTQGTAFFGFYGKLAQPKTGTKIVWEVSGNYNTSSKGAVFYTDAGAFSIGMSNSASSGQRRNDYTFSAASLTQITALFDRSLTGTGEIATYVGGTSQTPSAGATTEQTTTFTTNYDVYIGSRASASLFADLNLETLVFYNSNTSSVRTSIEALVA